MSRSANTGPESSYAKDAGPQPRGEVWTIQALRFVAAFAVVLIHCTFYTRDRMAPDFAIYAQGYQGVRLFFVISGFVMIVSSERLMPHRQGWRIFALKRILRIVPLYWLITTVKLALVLATTSLARHTLLDVPFLVKSYFFIPAMNGEGKIEPFHGVGWTLDFEMFFYLLFTIAMVLRVPPVRAIAVPLAGLAVLSLWRTPGWADAPKFLCDPIVLDFLAGMIAARWYQRGLTMPRPVAVVLAIVGLGGLFAPLPDLHMPLFLHSLIVTALCFATITAAVALEPWIGRKLPRPILFVGAASYSLYLIHPMIAPIGPVLLVKLHLLVPVLSVLIGIVASLVAGSLCYRFVEKPIVRFLERQAKGMTTLPDAARARFP